jgi:hypothetical protein
MPTMPSRSPAGQPDGLSDRHRAWFGSPAGQALVDSESAGIHAALAARPGQAWLWLAPMLQPIDAPSHGLQLQGAGVAWDGPLRCALPLPLANESVATVVLQHAARRGRRGAGLIEECSRVLVPCGQLWLYVLNPLSPYRWRWQASGLGASEPLRWRRRLQAAGLQPLGMSRGIGPRWKIQVDPELQQGPGLRAAYLLHAEKRVAPLTPLRQRVPLRIGEGVPAA